MAAALEFYVGLLGFEVSGAAPEIEDPAFNVLTRGGDTLLLSSHRGDGEFGQAIVVLTDDVNAVFRTLKERGFRPPDRPESPVHCAPLDQTWGTREWYVDDPDGNTIRFTQQ
jgi:uncharacterized glyoxalase superfamily protein PhnB